MKYCENIIVTFNCDFLFFLISFLASIRFFSFTFLFFSCFSSSTHVSPTPLTHSSQVSSCFYFSRTLPPLSTTCPLCFYFSFFISSSLFLILFLSPCHTYITGGEQSWNLKFNLPKRRVSKERELRDVL